MVKFGVGQPVRRTEDQRLLTGQGCYTDDLALSGQAHGYVVRSPHAHAEIRAVDTSAAMTSPGVVGIFTGEDVAADGLGDIPCVVDTTNSDGSDIVRPPRPALTRDRVRHVGEPVAFVVAETYAQARDAAELVAVDYADLPAVIDTAGSVEAGAPQVWAEAPGNVCFQWDDGDRRAVEDGLAGAVHVTRLRLVNNRVAPSPLEPRSALAAYDPDAERFTLYTPSQGVHSLQRLLSQAVFGVELDRFHVITGDVGGGFGLKIFLFPEQVLVCWAARKLGRPVRWSADRGEAFLGDIHARDHVSEAQMGLDAEGRILAIKVETIANLGAYLSNFGPFIASSAGTGMLSGVYTVPAVHVAVRGVFTNTCPIDAYRGAGRPEAIYLVERLIDAAARETGLSPTEIRRRNFIAPDRFPYTTPLGLVYDSGAFERNMDEALERADWAGYEARRAETSARGRLRGFGLAYYAEVCGGMPNEKARIQFRRSLDGGPHDVEILIGTQSNGQGHETTYAQLAAAHLGIDFNRVRVVQGDSALIDYGFGTGGSRAMAVGGSAVHGAADAVIAKGREIAAHLLEAAVADIEFVDGSFAIAGTDRMMTIDKVAHAAEDADRMPDGLAPGLEGAMLFDPAASTFPNGCHVCELVIDPQTGALIIERYVIVDDFGTVLNPLLLEGQVHGGVAQGLGQALLESCIYEPESGQLLTGSFMDYGMPRADDLPSLDFSYNEVPCANNPLGVKGCGEAGAIGAPPAIINAILDALTPLGVRHIDMPATPERIWRAVNDARRDAAGAAP